MIKAKDIPWFLPDKQESNEDMVGFNAILKNIGERSLEIVWDRERFAIVAYEQYMRNAKIEGKWEVNLTEYGKKMWLAVADAVIQSTGIVSIKAVKWSPDDEQ